MAKDKDHKAGSGWAQISDAFQGTRLPPLSPETVANLASQAALVPNTPSYEELLATMSLEERAEWERGLEESRQRNAIALQDIRNHLK